MRKSARGLAGLLLAVAAAGSAPADAPTVTGRLATADARTLDQVRVELGPIPALYDLVRAWAPGEELPAPLAVVRPDATGAFRVLAPAAGLYRIVVRAPGRVPMAHDLAPLLDDVQLPPVELPVDRGLLVQAVGPEGSPVAGARLSVKLGRGEVWLPSRRRGWQPLREIATADAGGRATVAAAVGEEVVVAGGAPGFAGAAALESADGRVVLTLAAGVERQAEVRRPAGPLSGAVVWVAGRQQPTAVSDARGRLRLTLPAGETAEVWIEAPGGWRGRFEVRSDAPVASGVADGGGVGRHPLRFVLSPPARLPGRLVSAATGEPVAGGFVWVAGAEGSAVETDDRAGFVLSVAGAAPLALRAAAPGFAPANLRVAVEEWPRRGDGLVLPLTVAEVLTGTVVDPGGAPVIDATVLLRRQGIDDSAAEPTWAEVAEAKVDRHGRFRFGSLPRGSLLYVRAEAPGRVPVIRTVRRPAEELRIVLGSGGALRGRLEGGDPRTLEQGRGRLFAADESLAHYADGERIGGVDVEISPQGELSAGPLAPGTHDLHVDVPGYEPLVETGVWVPEGGEINVGTLELRPEAILEGRVVDSAGEPIAGATVEVHRRGPGWPPSTTGRKWLELETDDRGRFRATGMRRGAPVDLIVAAEGFAVAGAADVELPREAPIEIALARSATIFGRVVEEAGGAVVGAVVEVEVLAGPGGHPALRLQRRPAVTDAEGRFELSGVPAGLATVLVSDSGRRLGSLPVGSVAEGARVGPVDIEVEETVELRGRVVHPDGRPAPGARVWTWQPDRGPEARVGHGFGDSLGRFRVAGLQPGPLTVEALLGVAGRAQAEIFAAAGGTEVELVLEERSVVAGRVVGPDGQPVASGTVALVAGESRRVGAGLSRDGRFELLDPEPGTYRLTAVAPGVGGGSHPSPVVVRAGEAVTGLEIRLLAGGEVAGRVVGLPDDLLADLIVAATPRRSGPGTRGVVHADGTFLVRGLAPGGHRLDARVPPGGPAASIEIDVAAGERLDGVEIDLSGLRLIVSASAGGVPVGTEARLVHEELVAAGRRLGPGRFAFDGLEPGRVRVAVRASPGGPWLEDEVEVEADREVSLDFEAWPVSGWVVDEDGEPLAGIPLWVVAVDEVVPRWGPPPPGLASGRGGGFTLPAVPAGVWRLIAGGGEWWGEAIVRVPAGGTAGVTIAVGHRPRGRTSGRD